MPLGVIASFLWDVSKQAMRIFFPAGLWEVTAKVTVVCSFLFASIDCIAWYKLSFKFFVQVFICWLLTCDYHTYCICIHWSWNFSAVVISNFQWEVSKPDIWISSPIVLSKVVAREPVFGNCTCCCQYINCLQCGFSSYSRLQLCR